MRVFSDHINIITFEQFPSSRNPSSVKLFNSVIENFQTLFFFYFIFKLTVVRTFMAHSNCFVEPN